MIDLSTIVPARIITPPRIVLYGPPKIGKTTFSADIPGNILLDIEGGSGALNVARIQKAQLAAFADVLVALNAMIEQEHNFSMLTVDSIDWLEALIFAQVAKEHGKKTIDEIGYGAGYSAAVNLWKQFLDLLTRLRDEKGMAILLIAHDIVKRYDNPLTESYDRHQLKLHAKSAAIITEWADCLLFANQEVYTSKEEVGFKKRIVRGRAGDRVLHTVESPAFMAGNRYGLAPELPFDWASFIDAFNAAMSEETLQGIEAANELVNTLLTTGQEAA